jgi:hypothetical protein
MRKYDLQKYIECFIVVQIVLLYTFKTLYVTFISLSLWRFMKDKRSTKQSRDVGISICKTHICKIRKYSSNHHSCHLEAWSYSIPCITYIVFVIHVRSECTTERSYARHFILIFHLKNYWKNSSYIRYCFLQWGLSRISNSYCWIGWSHSGDDEDWQLLAHKVV